MDRRLEIFELGELGRILTCENIQNKERSGPCIESVVEKFTQGPAWASATSLLSIDAVERVRHKMSESAVKPDPRFDLIIHAAFEKERIMMWEEKRLGDKEEKACEREQIWCDPAGKKLHSCVPKWMHDIIRQWRRIWKTSFFYQNYQNKSSTFAWILVAIEALKLFWSDVRKTHLLSFSVLLAFIRSCDAETTSLWF